MNISTNTGKIPTQQDATPVDPATLHAIVKAFRPDEIGLVRAWDEFYRACQAADASHDLLRAIHDIKESIEDSEQAA